MIQFREKRHFFQYFSVVQILVVNDGLLDGIDVAVELVLHFVNLSEASLSDELYLFKLSQVPASGILWPHLDYFFMLIFKQGRHIRLFIHVVKVKDLVVYFFHCEHILRALYLSV